MGRVLPCGLLDVENVEDGARVTQRTDAYSVCVSSVYDFRYGLTLSAIFSSRFRSVTRLLCIQKTIRRAVANDVRRIAVDGVGRSSNLSSERVDDSIDRQFLRLRIVGVDRTTIRSHLIGNVRHCARPLRNLRLVEEGRLLSSVLPDLSVGEMKVLRRALVVVPPGTRPCRLILNGQFRRLLINVLIMTSRTWSLCHLRRTR